MRNIIPLLPVFVLLQTQVLHSQAETARHRAVYAEINENAATSKTVHKKFVEEHTDFEITGWSDEEGLRKILVNLHGEHGSSSGEYYLENGRPLFVRTVDTTEEAESGKAAAPSESRYYFTGGELVKYLRGKEEPFEAGSQELEMVGESVNADFIRFKNHLVENPEIGDAAATKHAVGKFTGIEQGDYFHWNMTGENSGQLSFFILDGGKTVEKAFDNPQAFVGRKCRVAYTTSMADIPEAGGKMEIPQITGVEWLE